MMKKRIGLLIYVAESNNCCFLINTPMASIVLDLDWEQYKGVNLTLGHSVIEMILYRHSIAGKNIELLYYLK